MFVLDWTAYPIIMLCVAAPLGAFWLIEDRREKRADEAAGPMPCMVHVGTDRDGTELWCWQKYGHSGAHDDYSAPNGAIEGLRRLLGCPDPQCLFDVDHEGPHMCWEQLVDETTCVLPKGHDGDHSPFDDSEWDPEDYPEQNFHT